MEMMNYTIIEVLCHVNEWNLFTNARNTIVGSIETVVTYKKKNYHQFRL